MTPKSSILEFCGEAFPTINKKIPDPRQEFFLIFYKYPLFFSWQVLTIRKTGHFEFLQIF